MDAVTEDFSLGIDGFVFSDLHNPQRLRDLHTAFWDFVNERQPTLQATFQQHAAGALKKPAQSDVLIALAQQLEQFLAALFRIETAVAAERDAVRSIDIVFRFRQDFLRTRVFKHLGQPAVTNEEFAALDARYHQVLAATPPHDDPEIRLATATLALLACEKPPKQGTVAASDTDLASRICAEVTGTTLSERATHVLAELAAWCIQVQATSERRHEVQFWSSFVRPEKLDFEHLVQIEYPRAEIPEMVGGVAEHRKLRDGFDLTDPRMNRKEVLREVDYCIVCHPREKDSCSHGFRDASGAHQKNPLGIPLTGCPLEERISEMHLLHREGSLIAALAMVMLDNPMCPGTGHRICNDCMKGCIYQKQDPVNIPQTETGVVKDVLGLPFGFEIYSLLTRFNPLNHRRPYALPYQGVNVLVVGLGPAGYTLANYLANDGFGVVGIDGLKLEPLAPELTGQGRPVPRAIRDFQELQTALDERILLGFGGVSEYGITVRWDKTFLTVMYLTLLRRQNVRLYGGIRFGGTLSVDDAWNLGFHHVALAMGAGKPTVISLKNNLIRGIRKASDFLMALQLTGAFKRSSLANLQVQLPAVVIGGGLTAIDAASELLAYYPIQVEKALTQFERLSETLGTEQVWRMCDPEETAILKTFLEHGHAIRQERLAAREQGREPDLVALCQKWGGVSIIYRKKLSDSPAYRQNHEEVAEALAEGVWFLENTSPVEALPNEFGAVSGLRCERGDGTDFVLPARSVCVAAGTTPNTVYERELPGTFHLDQNGRFFQKHRLEQTGDAWTLVAVHEPARDAVFTSYHQAGRFVSYYGDNHPDFAGSVVKAMASAKHGAPQVARLFAREIAQAETRPTPLTAFQELTTKLDDALVPRVVSVRRLTPTIVEVVVRAPAAAKKFQPGQFFRLQNYETYAPVVEGVRLTLEGIALTGAWVDTERDLLGL
ncbi:MAG: FAD-dependent oxidoreductase, partial [Planctomycetes bacterium]|nr:FAD-dependent oxidoreductase [Planctomycetota bacterium]